MNAKLPPGRRAWERLRRGVALGLRANAGGPRRGPDTRTRRQGPSNLVSIFRRLSPARPEDRGTMRELAVLAWPITVAMLGETALGLSDTWLVGALGPGDASGALAAARGAQAPPPCAAATTSAAQSVGHADPGRRARL